MIPTSPTTCITFPIRPINGGKLELARPKRGRWVASTKLNGHRIVAHLPSLSTWNRRGEPYSLEDEFIPALKRLRDLLPGVTWVDVEGLIRRHRIGLGTLVVIDVIPIMLEGEDQLDMVYEDRRKYLEERLPVMPLEPALIQTNNVYLMPEVPWDQARSLYDTLKRLNHGSEIPYEGIVAKRLDTKYSIQKLSETKESTDWVKHRFAK